MTGRNVEELTRSGDHEGLRTRDARYAANMTRRRITIEVEIPGAPGDGTAAGENRTHDDQYADLANSFWMSLKATDITTFSIFPDPSADLQQLNDRWDNYTEGSSLIWHK